MLGARNNWIIVPGQQRAIVAPVGHAIRIFPTRNEPLLSHTQPFLPADRRVPTGLIGAPSAFRPRPRWINDDEFFEIYTSALERALRACGAPQSSRFWSRQRPDPPRSTNPGVDDEAAKVLTRRPSHAANRQI